MTLVLLYNIICALAVIQLEPQIIKNDLGLELTKNIKILMITFVKNAIRHNMKICNAYYAL